MHGLMDCNNFFVSCERVFNPALEGKPVVVLSNNDGCVISRSNEAKALGIPMGIPVYQIRDLVRQQNVQVISGNHTLYLDLSNRVMNVLGSEVERLAIYSVDEAFFDVPFDDDEKIYGLIAPIAKKIKKYVGIPVSIGAAPSRTLAKIASHIAKKERVDMDNVYLLTDMKAVPEKLKKIPVGDVWGIGRRLDASLKEYGINTAYDFTQMSRTWVKSQYSIVAERTQQELLGHDYAQITAVTESKQTITTSRSFGTTVRDIRTLSDAVVTFASNCGKRLRDQNSLTGMVAVHIRGDMHNENMPFYTNSCQLRLAMPSCSTMEIVKYAMLALRSIYREGYGYKKAAVTLSDITDNRAMQLNLFEPTDEPRQKKLMKAIDKINAHCGDTSVHLLAQGSASTWKPHKTYRPSKQGPLRIYSGMTRKEDNND
jgi:DNA polymerase V